MVDFALATSFLLYSSLFHALIPRCGEGGKEIWQKGKGKGGGRRKGKIGATLNELRPFTCLSFSGDSVSAKNDNWGSRWEKKKGRGEGRNQSLHLLSNDPYHLYQTADGVVYDLGGGQRGISKKKGGRRATIFPSLLLPPSRWYEQATKEKRGRKGEWVLVSVRPFSLILWSTSLGQGGNVQGEREGNQYRLDLYFYSFHHRFAVWASNGG